MFLTCYWSEVTRTLNDFWSLSVKNAENISVIFYWLVLSATEKRSGISLCFFPKEQE